ncbi:glycosyltransferase family 4 protein [Vibrio mediterranei]|uniref:glycosyltransferase family 4 protein n=1 Tax=Vibrio mediterranei TaxID=689 RepID=UPI0038CE2956
MKYHAVQLNDDYSGSSIVLCSLINTIGISKFSIAIGGGKGPLNDLLIPDITFGYAIVNNKFGMLLNLLVFNVKCFIYGLLKYQKGDVVIVNTLYPFASLVAARIKGARSISYIHETYISPKVFRSSLLIFSRFFANKIITVSKYTKIELKLPEHKTSVIYNSCRFNPVNVCKDKVPTTPKILMLSSLKSYKGIDIFLKCASQLSFGYEFDLALNCTKNEFDAFHSLQSLSNLKVYHRPKNLDLLYSQASIVLNLTQAEECIETFGLTLIEAAAFALPVVAPNVGGPAELIEKFQFGISVDTSDVDAVCSAIQTLLESDKTYCNYSSRALKASSHFTVLAYNRNINVACNL